MIFEEDIPTVQKTMERLTDGVSKHVVSSNRNYTKDRQVIYCEWYNSVLSDQQGNMVSVMSQVLDITERKRAEEQIYRQRKLLAAINSVFFETLTEDSEETVAKTCLRVAQEITNSKFGFIGEITPEGLFATTALSNPSWEACRIPETEASVLIKDMVIRGIWGQVLLKEQSLIINDPVSYPHRVGIPEGHPPLTSFLGIPLKDQGKVIGMIAMANNASGYTADHLHDLEALCFAFVEAIRRKRAEKALMENEERSRRVSSVTSDIAYSCITQEDGLFSINWMTGAVERISGYSIEEIVTQRCWRFLVIEEDLSLFEENVTNLTPGSHGLCELRLRQKNGGIVWVASYAECFVASETPERFILYGGLVDITERKQAEEAINQSLEQVRRAMQTTIQVLVMAVEVKDPYTAGHQRRMTDLARAMATEMGLPPEKIEGLRMAGVIHDIGKITLPTEILSKPTKLSDIEFSLIKEHVRLGYDILKDVESPWPLAKIVLQHHERMNGSGYPQGLKGDEILVEARILMVADVVEAITSHRPYRPALGIEKALEEISQNKGILYDPVVVAACLRLFKEKGYCFN